MRACLAPTSPDSLKRVLMYNVDEVDVFPDGTIDQEFTVDHAVAHISKTSTAKR